MKKPKPNLDAFRNRPDLVFVLNRFNYIESVLTMIITQYIQPSRESTRFVESIMLNNSIVSFSSKVKLFFHLNATEQWVSIKRDDFHRLSQIRNQFAHTGTQLIKAIPTEDGTPCKAKVLLMLESISGTGLLEQVDAEVALIQFTELCVGIREKLHSVLEKLREKNG